MRGLIALSLPLLATAAATYRTETIHEGAAPVLSSINSEVLPDNYIVVFKKHVSASSAAAHHSWVQDIHLSRENERTELRKRSQFPITTDIFKGIKHTYNIAGDFLGYAGHFDDEVIEKVRSHPDVSDPPVPQIGQSILHYSRIWGHSASYSYQLGTSCSANRGRNLLHIPLPLHKRKSRT
jgi:hypothetical protein